MVIQSANINQLRTILEWGCAEGWNIGPEESVPYLAADPSGYLVMIEDGELIAAICNVHHSDQHSFMGLYQCRKDRRGRGNGLAIWNAALEYGGSRNMHCEAVPWMEKKYEKSGFVRTATTKSYNGSFKKKSECLVANDSQVIDRIIAKDTISIGYDRGNFLRSFLSSSDKRKTCYIERDGALVGSCTWRVVPKGLYVGPFYANNKEDAIQLLNSCPFECDGVFTQMNIPEHSALDQLVQDEFDFKFEFHTISMTKGTPPQQSVPEYYSLGSLSLG